MSDTYVDSYDDAYGGTGGGGGGAPTTGDTYPDSYFDVYGQDGGGGTGTPSSPGGGSPAPTPVTIGGGEIAEPHSWHLLLYAPRGTSPIGEVFGRGRQLTLNLTDPSTGDFTVSGRDPSSFLIDEFVTDIMWRRDGVDLVRTRVGTSNDSIDPDAHDVTFTGVDYRGLLDRRYTTATVTTTAATSGVEQLDVVWQFIEQTQAQPGGDLGLAKHPNWSSTGVKRKDVWDRRSAIGEAITEIGQRRGTNGLLGFDWEVTPDLELRVWSPVRGVPTGFTIEYGVNCDDVQRSLDSGDYANYAGTEWTDKAGAKNEAVAQSSDLSTRPEGLWEVWEGGSWATTGEGLAFAQGLLAKRQGILPSYECHLVSGSWDPSTCFLGDTVGLTVISGRLSVQNVALRVQTIVIDIDDDGHEDVTVTLGTPLYKSEDQLWLYGRSITQLERR